MRKGVGDEALSGKRNHNHTRALPGVISIDAWHSGVEQQGRHLHIDVSFTEAKLGEESESKVRFKLSVRRAEVIFHASESEGLRISQKSVAREKIISGISEKVSLDKVNKSALVESDIKISASPNASAAAHMYLENCKNTSHSINFTQEVKPIQWKALKNSNGMYLWELNSLNGSAMLGRPWNPVEEPRLKFYYTEDQKIQPSIRIMARCRREDLIISEIELKSETKIKNILDNFRPNKQAAAEAFIRKMLETENLEYSDLSERLSPILIAETEVMQEIE